MGPGYAEWFCYNSLIKKVVIYPGVTRIGINLFRELAFLETVEWGTVKQISSCSFVGTGLTVIELPEGLEIVEQSAFTYNQNLEEIIFPESVYMIGRDFYNCPNLKRFVVKGSPEFELGSEDLGYFGNDDGTTVNVTVYGRPDSSSQLLALDEGVPFVALEE